jgi:hypothetical protein
MSLFGWIMVVVVCSSVDVEEVAVELVVAVVDVGLTVDVVWGAVIVVSDGVFVSPPMQPHNMTRINKAAQTLFMCDYFTA